MGTNKQNPKAIEVTNLTKQFGKLTAVDNISFEIDEGEVFGFLGPNGAGKTTTIRILTGLTKPSKGRVKVFNYDIDKKTVEAKRLIGVVPETANVYDDLSGWENLIFTSQLYQIEKKQAKKKARELLKNFELFDRKNDKAKNYSKGMKRRLSIAMGLISNPRLLFLDEPTSGLDVESSLVIKKIINSLSKKKVTVFLTTHDIEEASRSCDRVAIINHGKIAAIDTPEKLKNTIESVQSIEVAFDKTVNGQKIKLLDKHDFINTIEKLGDKYKLITSNPEKSLAVLWDFSLKNELKIISLNTFGPKLEEVFIKLTKNK